jgi:hypothetical protein
MQRYTGKYNDVSIRLKLGLAIATHRSSIATQKSSMATQPKPKNSQCMYRQYYEELSP